ncbi:hypothetical protein MTO96_042833, partial [Rhipicephalus appendiculatus]
MVDDVEFAEGYCPPHAAAPSKAAFEVERAGFFEELPRDHTTHSED